MALIPKFTASFDCNYDGFTMTQLTGTYNVTTNPGGYGAPNIATTDVDSTQLIVKELINDITFDTITTVTVSSSYSITAFELTSLLISGAAGFTDTVTDGIYSFTFKVVDGATTYQYEVRKMVIPELMCMLADAMSTISAGTCKCDQSEYIDKWMKGFALVESLKGAAICGDLTAFSTMYDKTEAYLESLNCNC